MKNDSHEIESTFLHDCLNTIVHDLGGISGALVLRADVLAIHGMDDHARVLRSIAAEVRDLGHHTRLIGPLPSSGTLGPQGSGDLNTWWPVVERFGRQFLPRGVSLNGQMNNIAVPAAQLGPLSRLTLALMRDVVTRTGVTPMLLTMIATKDADAQLVTLTLASAMADGTPLLVPEPEHPSTWMAFALHTAGTCGASISPSATTDGIVLTLPTVDD